MIDLDRLFGAYAGDVPGASVLVRHRGAAHTWSFGLADVDGRAPATPASSYRLASVTKQFTAAAILLLADAGSLREDDPLERWLAPLPPWGSTVTIRHLLTHTSGVRDYEELIPRERTAPLHDADVLEVLRDEDAVDFPGGTRYRYSNGGYALLALVAEHASGMPFAELLAQRIFRPLGMSATVIGAGVIPHRAFGHRREAGAWRRADQSLTSSVAGDGGVYASVDDLARWDAELETPTLFAPESLARAFAPSVATDVPGVAYGWGWKIGSLAGRRTLFHAGWSIGFRNALLRMPDERLTVAVLTNRDEGRPLELAEAFAQSLISA